MEENKQLKAKVRRKKSSYSRTKGHAYERQIVNELKELGFTKAITTRSESKRLDDAKIDITDLENKLPCYIQCKKTQNTPKYLNIVEECPIKDKPLVLFWNKQELKEHNINITSKGEVIMLQKDFFYTLIKNYVDKKD